MAVLMPTTRPRESASAPPELPGLRAASVWMTFSTSRLERPSRVARDRPRALTTPAVTVPANPSGLPIATTSWPTRSRAASPSRAAGRLPSARTTARSDSGSRPTTRSSRSVPSTNAATPRSEPATTWADVTRKPSGVNATAEPDPPGPQPPCRWIRTLATDGMSASATELTAAEYASRIATSSSSGAAASSGSGNATGSGLAGGLAAADADGPLLEAANDLDLERYLGRREGLDQGVGIGRLRAGDGHNQVAFLDPGTGGIAVVLDTADQEAVTLRQADRAAQPPGHEGRRDRDAEPSPARGLAAPEGVDPVPEGAVRREREVEALAEAVRVEADQSTLAVEERSAG